jgi:2-amino-4-hydroxy-6-hydroxymethyldihydropteridine diphosphokinase
VTAKADKYIYYLLLGSNIEPESNLRKGIECLRQFSEVQKISSVWETEAIGAKGPNFLNAAVCIASSLSPKQFKNQILQNIETKLGRVRTKNKFAPRTIDIDIVIYNQDVMDNQLWTQLHYARPLSELLPDFINIQNGETLLQTNQRLTNITHIKPRPDVTLV